MGRESDPRRTRRSGAARPHGGGVPDGPLCGDEGDAARGGGARGRGARGHAGGDPAYGARAVI